MGKYLTSKNCAILKLAGFSCGWVLICAVSATGFSLIVPVAVRPVIRGILFVLGFFSIKISIEKESE